MAYQIFNTDGSLFATIPDGTILGNTSVTLVGKNWAGYGAYLDTNFLHLMQNFSNSSAPGNPQTGQLWWNSSANVLNVYSGTVWKSFAAATASPTAPTTGNVIGDLWYNSTAQVLYVWNGSTWLAVGPSVSNGTGALTTNIMDSSSVNHAVIELIVNGDIVGIVSEASFTPAVALAGFPSIGAGLTMSANIAGGGTEAGVVASYVDVYGNVSATGNVYANNFIGNVVGNISGNVTGNLIGNLFGNGNISTTGNISAGYFIGNGAFLTGISGGGGGNTGAGGAITLNTNSINASYTMPTGFNGVSAGPITMATGVTITISTGSNWSIV